MHQEITSTTLNNSLQFIDLPCQVVDFSSLLSDEFPIAGQVTVDGSKSPFQAVQVMAFIRHKEGHFISPIFVSLFIKKEKKNCGRSPTQNTMLYHRTPNK